MLVADDRALQEQGMELLGVVEDLSEWTRLGADVVAQVL